MDINKNANLSMLCDYYELTMGNGYFVQGMQDRITYFDIFFRSVPDNGGFAIAAGLEQAIEYVQQLHFDEDDIAYLRSRNMFDEGFLQYLRGFRFTGDIWAVPEGTPIFPREPIMTVRAPAIQAQLVETFLLLTLNHQRSIFLLCLLYSALRSLSLRISSRLGNAWRRRALRSITARACLSVSTTVT